MTARIYSVRKSKFDFTLVVPSGRTSDPGGADVTVHQYALQKHFILSPISGLSLFL